jgi:hypothetical protein
LGWREGEKGRVLSFGIKEKVQLCGNMIELCKKSKIKQAAFFFFLVLQVQPKNIRVLFECFARASAIIYIIGMSNLSIFYDWCCCC